MVGVGFKKGFYIFAVLSTLSACNLGGFVGSVTLSSYGKTKFEVENGTHYKVGKPYVINGRKYYPREDYTYVEDGMASWYGPNAHAKFTANGGVYDMTALTAAHRTLPIPSIVRVTNLENGLSILVKITDRGPYAKNRILDLSYAAAKKLRMVKKGTALVRVKILAQQSKALKRIFMTKRGRVPTLSKEVSRVPLNTYRTILKNLTGVYVQVGVYKNKNNAIKVATRFKDLGKIKIFKKRKNMYTLYMVRLGPLKSVKDTKPIVESITNRGFDAIITVM